MNSLERIAAALQFRATDRVPVIAQVFGHAAVLAHVPLGDYVRDGELLARCQIQALDRYGYDAVFALMDVNVETEAMGSVLHYSPNRYPTIASHVLEGGFKPGALSVPDPHEAGRMPEQLKAVTLLRWGRPFCGFRHQFGNRPVGRPCVVGDIRSGRTRLRGQWNLLRGSRRTGSGVARAAER